MISPNALRLRKTEKDLRRKCREEGKNCFKIYTKMPALADDSGLEEFMQLGRSGLRFFLQGMQGEGADDRKNYEKLLKEMNSLPDDKKRREVCVCYCCSIS